MIVKRFMADTDPIRVVVVLSAASAEEIRRNFSQPQGLTPRRVINEKVRKNIASKVRPCMSQGALTREAAAYLTNWADGTLTQKARPASYAYLRHRNGEAVAVDGDVANWAPPHRDRHIDLQCAGEFADFFSDSDEDADDGEINMALADD